MALYFVTNNKNKYLEIKKSIPRIKQLEINLPEIQEIDARTVLETKLLEAFKYQNTEFIVEDTSLYLDCLNGLPGPLIKWFLKAIGNEGIFNIVKKMGDVKAKAQSMIGYAKSPNEIYYFDGTIYGEIVNPSGNRGFGWDSIFRPDGYHQAFAEMDSYHKNFISMRRIAVDKLIKFLDG